MATTRQQLGEVFGILHAFTLGTILLVGACVAPILDMLRITAFGAMKSPTVDLGLWIAEGVLYLVLGFLFGRTLKGVLMGFVLGFGTRLLASVLIFILTSAPFGDLFSFHSTRGMSHTLAVIIAVLALVLSFRNLLARLGTTPVVAEPAPKSKVRFSFDNAPAVTPRPSSSSHIPLVLSADGDGLNKNGEPASHLRPPEGFSPIFPREDIVGTVMIPVSVILPSVPEAKTILQPGYSIPVRLAYFVPQLSKATAWLSWKQVFEKGVPPLPNIDTSRLEPDFFSRWIRIPAKYYALQVPQEYYKTKKQTPAWMKLPEVEQEADISFKA